MVGAQIIGAEQLLAKFAAAQKAIPAAKPYHLRQCGDAIQNNIQMAISASLQIRTGALWDSVRVFGETKNGISVGTGKDVDYTWPLEFGSIPHIIVYRGAKGSALDTDRVGGVLAFYWEREARWFFGPRVWHPGNRPYRFVYNGAMASWPEIAISAMQYLREVFGVPL